MEEEVNKITEEAEEPEKEAGAPETEAEENLSRYERWKRKRVAKKEAKRIKDAEMGFWQNFFETVLYFAVVILVALSIKKWVGQPVIVSGDSMNDTLNNANFVWTNKINYKPKRFDVVTVKSPKTDNNMYIKRVVAMPGETIFIDPDEKIHIIPKGGTMADEFVPDDPYGYFSGNRKIFIEANVSNAVVQYDNVSLYAYQCGSNEYFVMGDNRRNSKDSRSLGAFKRSEIIGHAVFRIWPLNKLGDFDKSNK